MPFARAIALTLGTTRRPVEASRSSHTTETGAPGGPLASSIMTSSCTAPPSGKPARSSSMRSFCAESGIAAGASSDQRTNASPLPVFASVTEPSPSRSSAVPVA